MKRFKFKKLNNDGAALILAILIVMFVTILTTLLLYVSVINYEMKTTDYSTKVSFYGAEEPLEELKKQLAVDTAKASEYAYEYVLKNYGILNSEVARAGAFQSIFFDEFEQIWNDRILSGTWKDAMKIVLDPSKYDIIFDDGTPDGSKAYHIILEKPDLVNGTPGTCLKRDETEGRIFLKGITVEYEERGYLSVISTDFCIDVPELNWSVEGNAIPDTGVPANADRKVVDFETSVSYIDWTKK